MRLARTLCAPSIASRLSPAARARLTPRSFSSASTPINPATAAYELCTWDVKPTEYIEFLQLTKKHLNTRLKYGPLIGYWATEIGGVCQVVQLWQYKDLDQRLSIRMAMREDKEWQSEYMPKLRNMVTHQENIVLNKFPWAEFSAPPSEKNIWELRQYTLKPGAVPVWATTWTKGLEARSKLSKPYGVFFTEFGPLNAVVHLWPYKSFAHRAEVRTEAVKDPLWKNVVDETMPLIQTMQNKVLVPLEFSPIK
eukprot:Phypoly_transcript_15317.p1 GENE.Phypoly_transcript_15317~~Phypoly_transcript_15317.p1  ORF type:complete len:252 (+),score=30.31 Phypoly_transcript_15317:71-826(+)